VRDTGQNHRAMNHLMTGKNVPFLKNQGVNPHMEVKRINTIETFTDYGKN